MDNLSLRDGESIVKEQLFTPNLLLFWMKTKFVLTNKRLVVYKPNFIFGLIPKGYERLDQPLRTISAISSSTKYNIISFIFGVIMFIFGVNTFIVSFQLLPLLPMSIPLLIASLLLIASFKVFSNFAISTLTIKNNGGLTENYSFSFNERKTLNDFSNDLQNNLIY